MAKSKEEKAAYQRAYRAKRLAEDPQFYSKNYSKHKEAYISREGKRAKEQAAERRDYYRHYRADPIKRQRLDELAADYRKTDKGKAIARCSAASRRHLIRKQEIAKLYKKEIQQIYFDCPDGMVVDHEVPIKGKTVCGLHVPWNMQYLTPSQNSQKNNKFN